jgi:hypothetical protein
MLKVFDRMSGEYGFHVVDASKSINQVAAVLRRGVAKVIDKGVKVTAPEPQPEEQVDASRPATIPEMPRAKKIVT